MRQVRKALRSTWIEGLIVAGLAAWGGEVTAMEFHSSGVCGDGALDPREECDPGLPGSGIEPDLGGKTCQSEGFAEGALACTVRCRLDRSACTCGAAIGVPRTGQTECWNQSGDLIDCAETGQDGDRQAGTAVDPRFTDNGDGTVTDNATDLIWLKDAGCFFMRSWQFALVESNNLASGSCGLTDGSVPGDWRLPNVNELMSLFDYGQPDRTLPPGPPFIGVQGFPYWSSTTRVDAPTTAWTMRMSGARIPAFAQFKALSGPIVWPVRGGR